MSSQPARAALEELEKSDLEPGAKRAKVNQIAAIIDAQNSQKIEAMSKFQNEFFQQQMQMQRQQMELQKQSQEAMMKGFQDMLKDVTTRMLSARPSTVPTASPGIGEIPTGDKIDDGQRPPDPFGTPAQTSLTSALPSWSTSRPPKPPALDSDLSDLLKKHQRKYEKALRALQASKDQIEKLKADNKTIADSITNNDETIRYPAGTKPWLQPKLGEEATTPLRESAGGDYVISIPIPAACSKLRALELIHAHCQRISKGVWQQYVEDKLATHRAASTKALAVAARGRFRRPDHEKSTST